MKRLLTIAITGAALSASPAIAGMSFRDAVNSCLEAGDTLAGCVQNYKLPPVPADRAGKIAACVRSHDFNGKSVTRKQWLGCGLPL